MLLFFSSRLLRIGCDERRPRDHYKPGGAPPTKAAIEEALSAAWDEYRAGGGGGVELEEGSPLRIARATDMGRARLARAILQLGGEHAHDPLLATWSGRGLAMQSESHLKQKVENLASLVAFCCNAAQLLDVTRDPKCFFELIAEGEKIAAGLALRQHQK